MKSFKGIAYAAIAFLAMACGPDFERIDFNAGVQDEFGGQLNIQRFTGHEGMVVKSHVTVWDDDKDQMKLNVNSGDPNIVEVGNIISPNDFAFICKKQGTTTIEFRADDELVFRVEAVCLAQPESASAKN